MTAINRENRERRIQADADARALTKIDHAIAGIISAIENGLCQPSMKARMAELEREKAEIAARLAEAPTDVSYVHPGLAEIYKCKVARLTVTLADFETGLDASSDIRSLAGEIVLYPGDEHTTLHGSLMGIIDLVNDTPHPEKRTKL